MAKYGKWETIKELGIGGQGRVYLVNDIEKLLTTEQNCENIRQALNTLRQVIENKKHKEAAKLLADSISCLSPMHLDTSAAGALKLLHQPSEAEIKKAKARMKDEVQALSRINHPNILKILDQNIDAGWFVGEYHPKGPLSAQLGAYKGNMLGALLAFRPLVEGVAKLHEVDIVHRDIKPQNVFVSTDNRLVLGDMGIVFFSDSSHTRITDTYENVGSKDWMPPWAMGMRIEDIKPSFDVFCLGKVLWAMISGRPYLKLWYHHKDEFELEKMFLKDESIQWARKILDKCIVENEDECIGNAAQLLDLVDDVKIAVRRHAQVVGDGIERRCEVCGIGNYKGIVNGDSTDIKDFGLNPTLSRAFKIFSCPYCGHVQMFYIPSPSSMPTAWKIKA